MILILNVSQGTVACMHLYYHLHVVVKGSGSERCMVVKVLITSILPDRSGYKILGEKKHYIKFN